MNLLDLKLTDSRLRTYNGHQWTPGEWCETTGEGKLCGSGWIHYYNDATPALAVALNPIHANIKNPRLFRVEVSGTQKHEALKSGTTRLRLIEELPVPTISTEALVRWSILVVRLIPNREKIPEWESWVDAWLAGQDRSAASAAAAEEAARAAEAAAWAAEAAAWAAAWAAARTARTAWAAARTARTAAAAARTAWAASSAGAATSAAAAATSASAAASEEAPFAELLEQAIEEEAG